MAIMDSINHKQKSGSVADPALASTMRLPLEELVDPDAEMHLDIRVADDDRPQRLRLMKRPYSIGRKVDADITLNQPGISRNHARILYLNNEEIIEDTGSTNGTYVNGVRISRCVLQNNDIIRIGDATLLFTRTPRK